MNTSFRIFVCTVLSSVLLLGGGRVQAQTISPLSAPSGSVSIRPAKSEHVVIPGASKTQTFTLTNSSDQPLLIFVTFEDFAPTAGGIPGGSPVELLGNKVGPHPLAQFLSTERTQYSIDPRGSLDIPVLVSVPSNTDPGGRYAAAIFTFKNISDMQGNGRVSTESRLTSLLYVTIAGDAQEAGRLANFGVLGGGTFFQKVDVLHPLRFYVSYENTGTVHLNPYGRITLRGIIGQDKEIILDPQAVLPGAIRTRDVLYDQELTVGVYTAHLEQNRGYQDIVDESTVRFFVLPSWAEGGFILLVLGAFGYIMRRGYRMSKHRLTNKKS